MSEHDNEQQNFVVLVSAFCQQTRLIEEVERFENGKQSEMGSVRDLLIRMQQRGFLLTLDALHCKKTVALIVSQRQHYLIKVKGNQQKLLAAIQQVAAEGAAAGHWQECEHSRGREVHRALDLFPASAEARAEWPGLV